MALEKIPLLFGHDKSNPIGAVIIFGNDNEEIIKHAFKNQMPIKLEGAVNLSTDKIVYLALSPYIKTGDKYCEHGVDVNGITVNQCSMCGHKPRGD